MNEVKTYVVTGIGALFVLMSPIHNFMVAMLLLFVTNFLFGLVAARAAGEKWDYKKALKFLWLCILFFIMVGMIFIVGYLMGERDQSAAAVKMVCWLALYIFGTNIIKNWHNLLTPGTTWYKFVDLLYYILSIQFVEKLPFIKKWQESSQGNTTNTVLDKDNF